MLNQFIKSESASGILLMFSAFMAMLISNTPLQPYYALLLDTPVEVRFGALEIAKPLLLWINDGLMAIFFFLVGLELKRELIEGGLSDKRNIILPAIGAFGGMLVPALVYSYFNWGDAMAMQGWAIPAATDIAFALGILLLLGSKVPVSIKIFLTSLAIFDDIGAIIIIAIFYTSQISVVSLIVLAVCIIALFLLNKSGVESKGIYLLIGSILWVATLKSGVHATLAGVILAMFIPMRSRTGSPLKEIEHRLHKTVAFFVLPVFAFANAGIDFVGITLQNVSHSVPLGIALGLFVGKQLGVFSFCWLSIKLGLTQLPKGMSWLSLYGTAVLCGVGFTMSLFIGSLAFKESGIDLLFDDRIGIVLGSLVSGVVGYFILKYSLRNNT